MAILSDLVAMRELLDEPGRWCQDACARDGDGESSAVAGSDTVSWCLIGAALRVGADLLSSSDLERHLVAAVGGQVSAWNDAPERTHGEVLALLDGCIKDATPKQHYTHDGVPYFPHPREEDRDTRCARELELA